MKKWLFWLLLITGNVFSQDLNTKVIQLHYLQAEKVIQMIKPLLDEDDKVSGSGQTLIVKATPKTLTQIRYIIHQIDVPPVTFKVSIYQGDPDWLSSQNNHSIVYSTQPQSEKNRSQSVNVLNGEAAMITNNEEMPIVSSVGVGLFTGIEYEQHQVKNGYLVRPILEGSQVKLTIKRIREQVNPAGGQQFDNQKVDTTVLIPMDKWVLLGNAEGDQEQDKSSISYSAGQSFSQQSSLYIKVSIMGGRPVQNNP